MEREGEIEDSQWGCRVVDGVRAESEDGAVEEVEHRHLPPARSMRMLAGCNRRGEWN